MTPRDSSWRVGNVGDEEWDLKCHIRVDHVQNLKLKVMLQFNWRKTNLSISCNLATASLLQFRHAEPILKLPDTRLQVQVAIELECTLAAHVTRVLVRHHVGIGARLDFLCKALVSIQMYRLPCHSLSHW